MWRLVPLILCISCAGSADDKDSDPATDSDGPGNVTDSDGADTDDDTVDDTGTDTGTDTTTNPTNTGPDPCATIPTLPLNYHTLTGFTEAEDFDFNASGYHVSVDSRDVVGITQAGATQLYATNVVGGNSAGTQFLSGGDVIIADVNSGSLVRVTPQGAATTLLSGLNYPNGIDIDEDDSIIVAENSAARVRRVDPNTGDFEIIAEGISQPNGVIFGPDYNTIYIGTFGPGNVWALDRLGGNTWSAPRLHGIVGVYESPADMCIGRSSGDTCYLLQGGVGTCNDPGTGVLICEGETDYAACAGANDGTPCQTSFLGQTIESICVFDGANNLFCPRADGDRVEECEDAGGGGGWGGGGGDSCTYNGQNGDCEKSWEGVQVCEINSDDDLEDDACDGLSNGDICEVAHPVDPFVGTCGGGGNLSCQEPNIQEHGNGQLDGINVDQCGYVYVTEWISGRIWRLNPEGWGSELAADVPSTWIPNIRWGNNVGGWDPTVLYVADRDDGRLFGLEVGLHSATPNLLVP